ncbi:Kiwa anti-phage protein KwaB-like domain-containing protein [Bacillus horti]
MTDQELGNLDLHAYLVTKASESDELYIAKKELLHDDVRKFLKSSIRRELNDIKHADETENKIFHVTDYNHEITKNDYIAKLTIDFDATLKSKINKLVQSLIQNGSDFMDLETKFQVIEVAMNSESAYFIYYRGVKKTAINKKSTKRIQTIRHGQQLVLQNDNVVEFGGKIEMFILGENIYVINPKTLEHTFDYTDHISQKRDANLNTITQMSFFDGESKVDEFVKSANKFILSRGIAQIKNITLEVLEEQFENRCEELKRIKADIPEGDEEKKAYKERYQALWPLYDHLDLVNYKVRFDINKSVTPLLHFFSDKIVESFLTKQFRDN